MSDDVLELTPPRALSKRAQAARRKATARLVKMHGRYGHGEPGVKCGGCAHLVSGGGGSDRTFWKCELYGNTRSEASDWRKRWPACGQSIEAKAGRPVPHPRGAREVPRGTGQSGRGNGARQAYEIYTSVPPSVQKFNTPNARGE